MIFSIFHTTHSQASHVAWSWTEIHSCWRHRLAKANLCHRALLTFASDENQHSSLMGCSLGIWISSVAVLEILEKSPGFCGHGMLHHSASNLSWGANGRLIPDGNGLELLKALRSLEEKRLKLWPLSEESWGSGCSLDAFLGVCLSASRGLPVWQEEVRIGRKRREWLTLGSKLTTILWKSKLEVQTKQKLLGKLP